MNIPPRQLLNVSTIAVIAVVVIACRGPQPAETRTPGGQLYAVSCSTCHGPAGKGVGDMPKIVGSAAILGGDYARTVIAEGRNAMPSFGATLTQEQIDEIVDYVATFKG